MTTTDDLIALEGLLTASSLDDDGEEPTYNLRHPEDTILWVEADQTQTYPLKGFIVHEVYVMADGTGISGAACYEQSEGCGLSYTFGQMWEDDWADPTDGAHTVLVIEDMTSRYTRGDGWMTDDDVDHYITGARPATTEEMAGMFGANFWASEPENVA